MLLQVKDLYKTYRKGQVDVPALHGVNLEIHSGDFAALSGPSGSGKTTLLNCVGCLDDYEKGEIYLEDKLLTGLTSNELAELRLRSFSFIFQSYNLIPVLSAFENVELPLRLLADSSELQRKERVLEMLDLVGLSGLDRRKPSELSGGQQQRVSIARALVKSPKIVLADEPTANLDSVTALQIIELMEKLNRDKNVTFLFSTHDEKIIHRAHKNFVMEDGVIQADKSRLSSRV